MQLCRGTIIDWIVTQSERDLVCEVKLFAGIICSASLNVEQIWDYLTMTIELTCQVVASLM